MRAGTARSTNAVLGALCIAAALFLTVVPAVAGPPEGAGPPEDAPVAASEKAAPQGEDPVEPQKEPKAEQAREAPEEGTSTAQAETSERAAPPAEEKPEAAQEKREQKAAQGVDPPADEQAKSAQTETPLGTADTSTPSDRPAPRENPKDAEPQTLTVFLHEPHRGTTVEDWVSGCTEGAVWHFVLNQLDPGTESLTLTADFQNAGELTDDGRVVGNGSAQHFHITTGVPETIINAWVEVTVTVVSATGPVLVISDVACAEEPPEEEPPVVVEEVIDVSIVKTNDADGNGAFSDEEVVEIVGADAPLEADVTFQAVITNPGEATVEIASLVDRFGGTELAVCGSLVGHVLGPGASTVCQFEVADYEPTEGLTTVNTVEVVVRDPDDPSRTASAEDPSTVHFVRVEPVVVTPPPSVVTPPGPAPERPTIVAETLPFTGLDLVRMALLAAGLLLGGSSLLAGRREETDLGIGREEIPRFEEEPNGLDP